MKTLIISVIIATLISLSALAQEQPKDNDRQGPPPWAQAQRGERGPMMQQERGRQGPPPWAQARRGNGPEVKKGECYCKCPCHNQRPDKDIKKNKKSKRGRR